MAAVVAVGKSTASNGLHVQLMTDLKGTVSKEKAEQLGFAVPYTNFVTAADNEIACYKPFKGYVDTPKIVAGDTGRDYSFSFNRAIARAYAELHPVPEMRAAGKEVLFLFNEIGEVPEMEYATETAAITQLVAKMRTEPYASALTKINQEGMPDMLESYNNDFHETYSGRTVEELNRSTTRNMRTLRPISDAAFNELANAINALYTVNELVDKDEEKREELESIINDMNRYLNRFRKTLSGSASTTPEKGEETKPDDTEPTEPTDPEGGETTEEGGEETTDPGEGEEEEGTGAIPHP